MLRPSTRSWRNFAIKIALFWFAKLWICQIDVTRPICHIVERGFLPDDLRRDGFLVPALAARQALASTQANR